METPPGVRKYLIICLCGVLKYHGSKFSAVFIFLIHAFTSVNIWWFIRALPLIHIFVIRKKAVAWL